MTTEVAKKKSADGKSRREEMVNFCCKNHKYLTDDDKHNICKILDQNGLICILSDYNDGCYFDFDRIEDDRVVGDIYGIVKSRINKLSSRAAK